MCSDQRTDSNRTGESDRGKVPAIRSGPASGDSATRPSGFLDALERLRSDAHLAILCVFGVAASLATVPFGVYRLLQGQIMMAMIDALVIAVIAGGLIYAWKTGRNRAAGNVIATMVAAGAVVAISSLGLSFIWLFSLIIAIFLTADNRVGIALSLVAITVVGSTTGSFASRVEWLTFLAVAIQVAVFSFVFSWRNARQHRQLDVMANRDPLTGSGNRRALQRELGARIEAIRIGGGSGALAILDLDHFKTVNDRHGHDAGDRVLIELTNIVEDTMRSSDSFYRYGGEEFVLVMPGTPREGIAPALDKLQAAIHQRLRGPDAPVTVSVGAALIKADDGGEKCLARADQALYKAKSSGRDCFHIDPS